VCNFLQEHKVSLVLSLTHTLQLAYDGNKLTRFALVEQQLIEFNQIAMRRPDFKKTEDMFNRVMTKDQIAVVTLLEHRASGARLIVANTHIHWDPEFRDVKLVQVAMLMDEVNKIANDFARLPSRLNLAEGYDKAPTYNNGTKIPTIVCGDFNSIPDSGVYEFLSRGNVANDHEDFMSHVYGHYTSDGLSHKFNLKSAYSHVNELPFTNYTSGFFGRSSLLFLDYIPSSLFAVDRNNRLHVLHESINGSYWVIRRSRSFLPRSNCRFPQRSFPCVSDSPRLVFSRIGLIHRQCPQRSHLSPRRVQDQVVSSPLSISLCDYHLISPLLDSTLSLSLSFALPHPSPPQHLSVLLFEVFSSPCFLRCPSDVFSLSFPPFFLHRPYPLSFTFHSLPRLCLVGAGLSLSLFFGFL